MRPELRRWLWPIACTVLLGALVATAVDGRNNRRAAAAKYAKLQKKQDVPILSDRERDYLEEFGRVLGVATAEPPDVHDAARLAAHAGIALHKQRAIARGGNPATFATRDFVPASTVIVPLAAEMSVTLPAFQQCRYELFNKSDRTLPAPILYQGQRWDAAPELVATAGFREIADELDRAVAIWRFVSEHREHALPVTQDEEEHDVVKYLALYGYGFCDDTARAVSTLAELSGLKGRVWFIEGHVITEVFADGRWRMFDADQQVYFHRTEAPREILSVEELSQDRRAFEQMVTLTNRPRYAEQYIAAFLKRDDNTIKSGGVSGYRIQPALRGGERLSFTNYNWGRYFPGRYPTPGRTILNGSFLRDLRAGDFEPGGAEVKVEPMDRGCRIVNRGSQPASVAVDFMSPFPIVGGVLAGAAQIQRGEVALRLEDRDHGRTLVAPLAPQWSVSLDGLASVLTETPTYRFTLSVRLGPDAEVRLTDVRATTDFQFARLALLPLRPGENRFQAHFPEGCDPAAFELVIVSK
jgi:hypothetical protein